MNKDRVELFDGKTIAEILQEIYTFSVEERDVAMAMFNKLDSFIEKAEDGFMQGDKPSPYLDSAHKATENIIKMLQTANKIKEISGEGNGQIDLSQVISLLDEKDIAPDRMKRKKVVKEEKEADKEKKLLGEPLKIIKKGNTNG